MPIFQNYVRRPNFVSDEKVEASRKIPNPLFHDVLGAVPISTVDFVPTRFRGPGLREFLLGLRTEEPFKDTWFVTGGRTGWGERKENALYYQAKRELNIDLENPDIVFLDWNTMDVENPASGDGLRPHWFSKWQLYEIHVPEDLVIVPRAENKAVKWFTHILPEFPQPVQDALLRMNFYPVS